MNLIRQVVISVVATLVVLLLLASGYPFGFNQFIRLARGTAAERGGASTTTEGSLFYNSDSDRPETSTAATWLQVAAGTPTDDHTLVADGTAFTNKALSNGLVSYSTSTNSFAGNAPTDDNLVLADGTSWNNVALTNSGTYQCLAYATASNTFSQVNVVASSGWTAICPSGENCEDSAANLFMGNWTPTEDVPIVGITCNALVAGTGTNTVTFHVYDINTAADVCTGTMACNEITRSGKFTSCTGTLGAGRRHGIFVGYSCTSKPLDVACTVSLGN